MPSLLFRLSDNNPSEKKDDYADEDLSLWLRKELHMLISSRSRNISIESMPVLDETILNYGINESFLNISELSHREILIVESIKIALQRFEPRLSEVQIITRSNMSSSMLFEINALHMKLPLQLKLEWNAVDGRFHFNE